MPAVLANTVVKNFPFFLIVVNYKGIIVPKGEVLIGNIFPLTIHRCFLYLFLNLHREETSSFLAFLNVAVIFLISKDHYPFAEAKRTAREALLFW